MSNNSNRPELIVPAAKPPNEQTVDSQGSHATKYAITVQPYLQNPLYAFEAKAKWGDQRADYSLAKYGPTADIALEKLHRALDEIDGEIEFDDGTSAPLVRGVIPDGVMLAAWIIVGYAALFVCGMAMAAAIIAGD